VAARGDILPAWQSRTRTTRSPTTERSRWPPGRRSARAGWYRARTSSPGSRSTPSSVPAASSPSPTWRQPVLHTDPVELAGPGGPSPNSAPKQSASECTQGLFCRIAELLLL